jgi:hypothetical protein
MIVARQELPGKAASKSPSRRDRTIVARYVVPGLCLKKTPSRRDGMIVAPDSLLMAMFTHNKMPSIVEFRSLQAKRDHG